MLRSTRLTRLKAKATMANRLLEQRFGRGVGWKASPMDMLVGVILSQNTSEELSWRAFRALEARFPSWEACRAAPAAEIAAAIRCAGLWRIKSRRIKRLLASINAARGSLDLGFLRNLPLEEARAFLESLEGIGPKSSAVVLNFCFGHAVMPLDTHNMRVLNRLSILPQKISSQKAHALMNEVVPDEFKTSLHVNLIKLGRSICMPRAPKCLRCPLKKMCRYRKRVERMERVGW